MLVIDAIHIHGLPYHVCAAAALSDTVSDETSPIPENSSRPVAQAIGQTGGDTDSASISDGAGGCDNEWLRPTFCTDARFVLRFDISIGDRGFVIANVGFVANIHRRRDVLPVGMTVTTNNHFGAIRIVRP